VTGADVGPAELAHAPLGHPTRYPDAYAPALLCPVPRAPQRAALGIAGTLPFTGADVWTAWECAWLDATGRPQVAVARIDVPATSPRIVESKSVKLYLGSFAQTRFDAAGDVTAAITHDVSAAAGAPVRVMLDRPGRFGAITLRELDGTDLDALDIGCSVYDVDPSLLETGAGDRIAETLRTDLFRSICPVTGQPDLGSVRIAYEGAPLDRSGLLRYLVSYRGHAGFHEHCVERIFMDLKERCAPRRLSVYARFTRRGGLDINPFRTNAGVAVPRNVRTPRQ
jgi:7-cyano-7-deazaguanine reductase